MDKVIVFEVWGDYAHFRQYFTTTSPLSYSVPPRTALAGLISAITGIYGIDKNEYLKHFTKDKARIALKITSPIKKVRISENLIDTKKAKKMHLIKQRTRIRFEFVKDPKYKIYFAHTDKDLHEKVKGLLQEHQCIYTPCLGLSELLCNFEYKGEYKISESQSEGFVMIDSIVPNTYLKEPEFENGKEYFSVIMPAEMKEGRVVTEYEEVLYERQGDKIKAKVSRFWELENNERILFL